MPLNIRINENYRITSDNFNVILRKRKLVDPTKAPNWQQRKAKVASPEITVKWEDVGYYPKIEQAINAVVDKTILDSDAETIPQLLAEISQIRRQINAVLTQHDE
ncbi:hypothetical protein [Virgibacillus proomii]|uniref:hypothetical protein n=1 Tax=Virgibacillus proomii TaxID=84407 RepID=UPI001C10E8BF|nr:hypothetical protein [Virgibacillus proomii]MBU5266229.1 hypothetical protein [Virgibacillus proomii]